MAKENGPSFFFSVRFIIALISFGGYGLQYMQRVNMSTAIVCMLNNTALAEINSNSELPSSLNSSGNFEFTNSTVQIEDLSKCYFKVATSKKIDADGSFVWGKSVVGLILSAYFYGYMTTQVAGGYLSMILGAKITLAGAIGVGSIFTLLVPLAADYSYIALVICRFMTGFAHGAFWPSMSSLWAFWAPPHERSRLVGIANAGSQIGNVVSFSLGGYLCVNGFSGGWPSIFYVFGIVGVVWTIMWIALSSKSPAEHHFISEKEKAYIQSHIKSSGSNKNMKTPWLGIITSGSFWGLVFAHFSSNFGTYLFLTQLPTYMKEVLKFDVKSSGFLASLPFIVFWFIILVSGAIADRIIMSKKLSKVAVRKLFNTLGLILPASAVAALCFVDCSTPYVGVALLTVGLATTGAGYGAGFMVNYNDVGGPFAGLIFGMVNTFGTMPGFIAPSLVGALTPNGLQSEWVVVFIITIIVYLVGALGYCLLAKAETEKYVIAAINEASGVANRGEDIPLKETKA